MKKEHESMMEQREMSMVRWMCGVPQELSERMGIEDCMEKKQVEMIWSRDFQVLEFAFRFVFFKIRVDFGSVSILSQKVNLNVLRVFSMLYKKV